MFIPQSVFSPKLEPFPVMPSSDNLFVIEEDEEGEKLQTIEEFSKDMGREYRFLLPVFWHRIKLCL